MTNQPNQLPQPKPNASSSTRPGLFTFRDWSILSAACLALVGTAWHRGYLKELPDTTKYNLSIQQTMNLLPSQVPLLTTITAKPPQAAYDLLKPNVLDARVWLDPSTGENFDVLLIHSGEGRDMLCHYPPNCYAGAGYKLIGSRPLTVSAGGLSLRGIEYEFVPQRFDRGVAFHIFNVMLLPRNEQVPDMDGLFAYMHFYAYRNLGAGQIQIRVPSQKTAEQRLSSYTRAVEMYTPVIRAIQADPGAVQSTTATKSTTSVPNHLIPESPDSGPHS